MIGSGPREIAEGALRLREVTAADADALYRWRMDERSRFMFRSTDVVPFATHRAFMERYFQPENTDRWFVIEDGGRAVGTITLYNISPGGSEAEWGRLVVDPEQRGHAYGSRALALLIRHAREMGVRTLRCEVLEGNDVAARAYRAAGFAVTAVDEHDGRRFVQLALVLGLDP